MSQPTFDKNDRIKSLANLYDEGTIDEHGLLFSQRWQAQGNGAFCHGKVTRVLKKKSRETQKYKIRWDDKSTSVAEHQHLVTECGVAFYASFPSSNKFVERDMGSSSCGTTHATFHERVRWRGCFHK